MQQIDFAAAATSMSSGIKTNIGYVGVNSESKAVKTIAELAKENGKKVGIVSSVTIDHATPASYYAHIPDRGEYYKIGQQMADSGFDYIAGGKPRVDKTPEGQLTIPELMMEKGWLTINADKDPAQFLSLKKGESKPVFAYQAGFASGAFEYEIDRQEDDLDLADFTRKGIEVLDNANGFFMMVEGGKIDWAGHANDAVTNIYDTIAFDKAILEAVKFYNQHPDETLIVVTGDHECGGLTLGWSGTGYDSAFEIFSGQTVSFEWFDHNVLKPYKNTVDQATADIADLETEIEKYFGLSNFSEREQELLERAFVRTIEEEKERSDDEESYILYGGYEPLTVTLTHILNNRAGLSWTSYSHTGVPAPIYAQGKNHELFNGYYDNIDIYHKLVQAANLIN
ncbi:alkaline phosphatase [Halanaerobium saccharolyticum]|uniref:Alkaline phosphatase n=2 Tax=Halanaerobium saccharolyticum TaxID=43595 RepID=A0A4R7Z7K6_9FIRM|nr:alkaline phosphatase [Halanaerobium saccharolyticum]RAK11733.1 alkaline phosphatase [Halanaerobium saccharolyticum]TDW07574.1 alkaline phosphatase [Halanaerobium saccharolyticum]TDX64495.1 alkaline phosphatase [Halanaerobium saccharolyticum]